MAQGSVDGVEDSLCGVALIGWTSDWRRSDSRAQWPAEDAETAIVRTRRCASAIRTPSLQSRGKVQLKLVCFNRTGSRSDVLQDERTFVFPRHPHRSDIEALRILGRRDGLSRRVNKLETMLASPGIGSQ